MVEHVWRVNQIPVQKPLMIPEPILMKWANWRFFLINSSMLPIENQSSDKNPVWIGSPWFTHIPPHLASTYPFWSLPNDLLMVPLRYPWFPWRHHPLHRLPSSEDPSFKASHQKLRISYCSTCPRSGKTINFPPGPLPPQCFFSLLSLWNPRVSPPYL